MSSGNRSRIDRRRSSAAIAALWLACSVHLLAQNPGTDSAMETAKRLVVMIEGGTKGAGVVFHVDNQRRAWIMTANHVVRPGGNELSKLTVRYFGTVDDTPATLRPEVSPDDDLAILVAPVPAGLMFPLTFGILPADRLTEGARVQAIGFPDGRRWGQTFESSPVVDVGSRRVKVDDPRVKKGYSGGILVAPGTASLVGLVLDTDGVTAEALLMDLALRLIRKDHKLDVTLGTAAVVERIPVQPPKPVGPPEEPSAGTAWTNPKDSLVYRWIPRGRFRMGCAEATGCDADEKPVHIVPFSRGFWMGETEVTQAAYTRVTGKPNPSSFKGAQLPVENVNWEDASAFCRSAAMRLPTEAEWEYAARAGTAGQAYGKLDEIAWFGKWPGGSTQDVGKLKPNAWGLRDVLGNVWEWVADWYDAEAYGKPLPAGGPSTGTARVLRGGSWNDDPSSVRVSSRGGYEASRRNNLIGFRCAGEFR